MGNAGSLVLILVLVVVGGLAFDFTNGLHDTASAAMSIATGALKPRVAVLMSAVLNFVGAFISIDVSATIAKGIVNPTVLAGGGGLVLITKLLGATLAWLFLQAVFGNLERPGAPPLARGVSRKAELARDIDEGKVVSPGLEHATRGASDAA